MPTPISIYSASSCSALVGLNPYRTPRHAWQIIMETLHPGFNAHKGWTLPPFPDSAAIRWGNAFEDAVIKLAEEKEQRAIFDREKTFNMFAVKKGISVPATTELSNPSIELSCHVDGLYGCRGCGNTKIKIRPPHLTCCPDHEPVIIHEGKTTNYRAFKQVKDHVARWGEPGTDQVPEEYQVQAAIQRICTGAELVKLSVLVFPKTQEDFEKEGWEVDDINIAGNEAGEYTLIKSNEAGRTDCVLPIEWARVFAQIGNFHTYNLPTNQKLESTLIEVIQEFDARYVKTQIPPDASNYQDIKNLLINPIGTIEATPEILKIINDHIELGRQLGDKSPLKIRREAHKVEILNFMTTARKKSGIDPSDKMIVIDPNGGDKLATLGLDKNGQIYFRTKSAE